jgi:hypothetical protein
MLVLITIFAVALLLIFTIFHRTLFPYLQQVKMKKWLSREGVEAEAVLLNVQQTGLYINNLPQMKLQMQVHPRTGRSFVIETHEVLSYLDLTQLHIGRALLVKYNPANTKEVMVVWQGATTPYPF